MNIVSDLEDFRHLFTKQGFLWLTLLVRSLCVWQSRHSLWRYAQWAGRKPVALYAWLRTSKWQPEWLYAQLWLFLAGTWGTRVGGFLLVALDDTHTPKPYAKKIADLGWLFVERVGVTDEEGKKHWGVWGQNGHCWVVLAILWRQGPGLWHAFPFAVAAYVRKKTLAQQNQLERFRTLYQKANEMLQRIPEAVLVVADSFYRGAGLLMGTDHHLLSRLTKAAKVYERPRSSSTGKRGRPQEYGVEHKLLTWVTSWVYQVVEVQAYQKIERVQIATQIVRMKGFGKRDLRVVVVRSLDRPELPPLFLMTTLLELTPVEVFQTYAARFSIELAFRQLKTDVGLGQYHLRSQVGLHHWVALVMVAYAILKTQMLKLGLPSIEATKRHFYIQELRREFLPLAQIPHCRTKILDALQRMDRFIA
jgi:hypothetical protein